MLTRTEITEGELEKVRLEIREVDTHAARINERIEKATAEKLELARTYAPLRKVEALLLKILGGGDDSKPTENAITSAQPLVVELTQERCDALFTEIMKKGFKTQRLVREGLQLLRSNKEEGVKLTFTSRDLANGLGLRNPAKVHILQNFLGSERKRGELQIAQARRRCYDGAQHVYAL